MTKKQNFLIPMKKQKILIIDDEQPVREAIKDLLDGEGYDIFLAENGKEGLSLFKKVSPILVILDLKMPVMNGAEFLQHIKISPLDPYSVIVLTGHGDDEDVKECFNLGVSVFFRKPFNFYELNGLIRHSIALKQGERELKKHRDHLDDLVKERTTELETINKQLCLGFEASRALSNEVSMNDLFQLILSSALNQTNVARGSLMIMDEKNEELIIQAFEGIEDKIAKNVRIKIGEGIAGRVAKEGKPILVSNISDNPVYKNLSLHLPEKSFISYPLLAQETGESLSIPLNIKKKVIGVLNLTKPEGCKPFSEGDLHLLSILASQAAISIENAKLVENLEDIYLSTIKSLTLILEGKSQYTQGHSERVTECAVEIAIEMKLTSKEIKILKDGAILHDIGKIGTGDAILNKPGKLTAEEYEAIKKHPITGYNMLKPIKPLHDSLPIIKSHHERMDGNGYPDGMLGKDIPLLVRICIVADAYDAMISNRPYRNALEQEGIFAEFERNIGTQFDKEVTAALIKKKLH